MAARVVVVTGGANGIGWAACRRFAQAGDHVVVADRDGFAATDRAGHLGGEHLGVACDMSREADVDALAAACLARHGRIDVLVNNAGVVDGSGVPVVDLRQEDLARLLSVNLVGTHLVSQAVGAVMRRQGGGAIVNLASCAGFVAAPLRSGYGATKAAIVALTQAMAEAWSADGVRVAALAPGYIRTALLDDLIARGKVNPAVVEARLPLGRLGRPEEMAEAIFHLASRQGACLSGQTLIADGGLLAYGGTAPASERAAPERSTSGPRRVVVTGRDEGARQSMTRHFTQGGDNVILIGTEAASAAAPDIDVLIDMGPTAGADPAEDFGRIIDNHLLGRFTLAATFGRRVTPGGAVVLVAPGDAEPVANPLAHYAVRAAVAMLARSLSCEWAPRGVRVNAILPGAGAGSDDLAATAGFLASDAASYVTGTAIAVGKR